MVGVAVRHDADRLFDKRFGSDPIGPVTVEMEIENVRIPFDKQQYADQLKTTTQFTEANVWSRVILRELMTAREHLTFFLEYAEQYARKINDPRRPYSVETWESAYKAWEQDLLQKA